jgi:hypothetical protein
VQQSVVERLGKAHDESVARSRAGYREPPGRRVNRGPVCLCDLKSFAQRSRQQRTRSITPAALNHQGVLLACY